MPAGEKPGEPAGPDLTGGGAETRIAQLEQRLAHQVGGNFTFNPLTSWQI